MTLDEFERRFTRGDGCPLTIYSVMAFDFTTEDKLELCGEEMTCDGRESGQCLRAFYSKHVEEFAKNEKARRAN